MDIGNRIKTLRKDNLKLTQANFGEKIGLKATAIGQMESGDRNVTDRTIILICNTFDVNEEWLRNEIGPMFIPTPNDELKQFALKYKFNDIEFKFLSEYVKLDISQRADIVGFLENIINSDASLIADTKRNIERTPNDNEIAATKEDDFEAYKERELQNYALELEAEKKGTTSSVSGKRKDA
ncbi:helix-turn-helix domain-containing protein [Clostridium botulinum]|uniref:helix-turn-helix domain-containing protein n=1 Tax=Clostridium botulinum TaxID=1491 RepID=UPI000A65C60D|nr:helix-turn-helix transcriptional regulator [Clostridium botulinum]